VPLALLEEPMTRIPVMTLNDALSDYFEMRAGRYAESTWEAHVAQLERMRTWLTREVGDVNIHLSEPDERMMVRYFNRLRPPMKAPATFNNYRQYVNMFWSFCLKEGWIRTNPMRHVDPSPVPKKVRLQLSATELMSILDSASARDRIGLALGMNTGLRSCDITALTVGSVNLTNDTLHAEIKKTRDEDGLPITAELREELIRWFHHYADSHDLTVEQLPNHWVLLPPAHFQGFNVRKPEMGGRVVYKTTSVYTHPEKIVQKALEKLGHPTKGEGFHTLRRSALRCLYNLAASEGVGDPIRIPQALAGHKNRQTTELYLGITHEKKLRDDMLRGKSFLGRVRQNDRDAVSDAARVPQTDQNSGGRVKSA
jgi:integrase